MPEHIRALIVVLGLSIPVLLWLRPRMTDGAMLPSDYRIRAGIWIALTLALFLAHNYWLFVLLVVLALITFGRNDSHPLGLYCFLLILSPPFHTLIPGFGSINYFLKLDYFRLLSVMLLLPCVLRAARDPASPGLFKLPADKYVMAYLVLLIGLQAPVTTTTDILRAILSQLLDVVLPYYAFSRALNSIDKLRDALAAFVAGCSVLAVIAIFESGKHWLLYSALAAVLNVEYGFGGYMERSGSLRAAASAGHSIILGYVLSVALGLHFALRHAFVQKKSWLAICCLLGAGVVVSFSRGPWVGAAAMLLAVVLLSPNAGGKLVRIAALSILVVPLLMLTPMGDKLINILPFIGHVDSDSVDYRRELFTVSWNVLMMNPLFGSPLYMSNAAMEQLRQGEGIIDMVNSYMGVAMYSGLVGVTLFSMAFVSNLLGLFGHLRRLEDKTSEEFAIGRALLATLFGVMVSIATLSSIDAVPVVYWCLVGICSAYLYRAKVASIDTATKPTADSSRALHSARST